MKEIGSEFWTIDLIENNNNNLEFLNIGKDYKLLMSGRTAIDYVINELDDKKKIVYMPDYCCDSMVQPFKDNGYKIEYYHVDMINNYYDMDENFDCSIFFAMSYFGYSKFNMDKYIDKFSERNIIVIEDITHRLLCEENHSSNSTYLIASLRKWFPIISGGIAINLKDEFKNNIDNFNIDSEFVSIKEKAMNLKKKYMNDNIDAKEEFLSLYSQSNNMIKDYKNKKMDKKSIEILKSLDIDDIKKKRIDNCKTIENKLKKQDRIKLLYNYNIGDCPLFVPALLENRDKVRKELINNNIFLPVHWPNDNDLQNEIYEKELSLINDQRYSKKDIEDYIYKVIEIVNAF